MLTRSMLLIFTLCLSACGSDNDSDDPMEPMDPPTFAATTVVNIDLTGAQQVPNNKSTATATATIEVDENLMLMRAELDVSQVPSVQAAHVHLGGIGENGDVVFAFTDSGNSMYTIAETAFSQEQVDLLVNEQLYINVHTTDFPDGEVRGQIVSDDTAIVTFELSGMQEVPAVTTMASGYGYASYNTSTTDLSLRVLTSGVEDATMAHIHTGRIGMNGNVLVALEQSTAGANVWMSSEGLTIDADTFAVLASGGHYVNVHTPANPSGELRGQILTDNFVLSTFALSGEQEVPAVNTMAMGSGYALIDTNDLSVELKVVTSGVEDATMAHIHTGRIGMNGGVLVALEQSMDDANVWMSPTDLSIDADTFAVLASGGHYVNVHTPANPSGELRGQILTDNFVLSTFALSGEQEVPAVNTMAMGSGYALIDTNDLSVELKVVTSGVEDATMAHIHTGRIGMNGGVLVALEQSMDDANVWMSPTDLSIDADTFAVLASGGHYVNVHTPANPSGELRGQILTDNFVLSTFALSGEQEVPAVNTMAMGSGYALIDTNDLSVELKVVTSGVEDATMAHIHTGRIGMNGGVLVALEQSMDDANVWMSPTDLSIDADTFAVLASGGHYVNVHTPANPSGELRGQILTDNFVLSTFALSGEQEVPAVNTMAMGSGYALIDTNDLSVELKVVTSGVEDATMAHIHTGRIGMNGGVLVALEQSMDDANVWMSPTDLSIDADTFAVLASGGHYVNVHTPANPSGELRGQILTDNFVLSTFALSGEQEVPAVNTMAMGSGYALIDTNDLSVELKVVTSGVEDATMAHIHTGRIGMNGGVLVALEQSMDDANVWMSPTDLSIDADTFAVLASGGHYVNVHTPANPSGELRGQILTDNFVLINFSLSGDQQNPAVMTEADGDGYALVNTNDFALELTVLTRGVEDATMAHIHTGIAGENGGVLVTLLQDMDDANAWFTPAGTFLNADIFAVLAAGGHYVNVHTPAHPSGEIRGQIQ